MVLLKMLALLWTVIAINCAMLFKWTRTLFYAYFKAFRIHIRFNKGVIASFLLSHRYWFVFDMVGVVIVGQLPIEVQAAIYEHLCLRDLWVLADSCHDLHAIIPAHILWTIHHIFIMFDLQPSQMFIFLQQTHAIISGSCVLLVIMPWDFMPNDIDIYVPQSQEEYALYKLQTDFSYSLDSVPTTTSSISLIHSSYVTAGGKSIGLSWRRCGAAHFRVSFHSGYEFHQLRHLILCLSLLDICKMKHVKHSPVVDRIHPYWKNGGMHIKVWELWIWFFLKPGCMAKSWSFSI